MKKKDKPILAWAILIAIFLTAMWLSINYWFTRQAVTTARSEIHSDLTVYGNFLSNEINRQLAMLDGIAAFVQSHIEAGRPINPFDFNLFAEGMHQNSGVIRNFSIAPHGIQRFVYPARRNRQVLGHNLLQDPRPQVRADVKRAIETRRIAISGPYELRQGGLGMIARKALFLSEEFWGLTAIVLDLPPILKFLESGPNASRLTMGLRTGNDKFFWGKQDLFSLNPETIRIRLPDGEWQLGGIPSEGWSEYIGRKTLIFKVVSLLVLILLIIIAHLVLNSHSRLKTAVLHRTKEIAEINALLKADIEKRKALEDERENMEVKLRQAQKMEAIGVMAGGIAHDFNNILFPIVGHVEMMLEDLEQTNPWFEPLTEVFAASMRAKDLVQQILAFSRQSEQEAKPIEVRSIVNEAMQLVKSILPSTIILKPHIDPKCGTIMADPTQIHQVVMNLITNAYHAMQDQNTNGILGITLKEQTFTSHNLPDSKLRPGTYVSLSISDTGKGIEPEILDRIFDPYFTTKRIGKGTGLGLSVVHGIVRSYDGEILVRSEPGEGSVFDVYFPRLNTTPPLLEPPQEEQTQNNAHDAKRILLVDDEIAVIQTVKPLLKRMGHTIEACISSRKALRIFKAAPDAFDLVITDMTMPEMTGDRLAMELLEIRPDLPIIICTGFSEKISLEQAEQIGIKGFLMKPVVKSELAEKIRAVLGSRQSSKPSPGVS